MATYDVIARLQAQGVDGFTKAFVGANRAMTNLEKSSTSFKKVGGVVTAAGLGMAVGLGKSVKVAANFEAGMSKVGAVSGASGKDMELLTAKAREMGSKTSFSATEAAEGLEYMALNC